MLKKRISFELSHLKSLLDNENSCVTVTKEYKGKLSLLPFHLGYLKHAVKEWLDSKVSSYDPELNGIILGHDNIKVINFLQHSDSSRINLSYIADIYLFTPTVGKTLSGVVNKKSDEHIGCLIHCAFNASIPKPRFGGRDLSLWLRVHGSSQIGNELHFTVSKVDFTLRVPYIAGVIATQLGSEDDEVDSGCCQDSIDESSSGGKVGKKKKKKLKAESSEFSNETKDICYHDPDQITQLFDDSPDEKPVKSKRKKTVKREIDDGFPMPMVTKQEEQPDSPSEKIKKKKSKKSDTTDNLDAFAVAPLLGSIKQEVEALPTEVEFVCPKIKQEIVSPESSDDPSPSKKKKSKKPKLSLEDVTDSLVKEAVENLSSPDKKKKKRSKHRDSIDDTSGYTEIPSCTKSLPTEVEFVSPKIKTEMDLDETSEGPSSSKKRKSKKSKSSLEAVTDSLVKEAIENLSSPEKRKKKRSKHRDSIDDSSGDTETSTLSSTKEKKSKKRKRSPSLDKDSSFTFEHRKKKSRRNDLDEIRNTLLQETMIKLEK